MLLQDEKVAVEQRLKAFEYATGCELLLVMTNQCDPYPGASARVGLVGGFLTSLLTSFYFDFDHRWLWPVSFLMFAVLWSWIGRFTWAKRMGLSVWETDRECSEKALELFHTLGTSKVSHKVTAMILVSNLEHKIEVLVDQILREKITTQELDQLIDVMRLHFQSGHKGQGLIKSIDVLEAKILADFGGKVSEVSPSELSDVVHFLRV